MSVRALLVAFATLGAAFTAQAQSVTTAPVGAVTKSIAVGLNSVGITLVNPDIIVASASANTANTITLTGISNVATSLTAGTLYYIEAVDGPLEGDRFDIDTAATIASASGVVTLNVASANNTVALSAGDAANSKFAIRRHVTLKQVQSYFTTAMVGNNVANSADQIWLLNAAGTAFTQYYLRADGTSWRLTTGTTNVADTVVVPPGTGILIQKRSAPSSIVVTGGVRVNDFAVKMPVGLSFQAPAYPIDYSPAALGGTVANGWTGNNTANNADQIRVLNSTGTNFQSYYLRADGTSWRLTTGTTNVASNNLVAFNDAFILSRKQADNDYILVAPTL